MASVHQKCYGSELLKGIPKGMWYCARCTDLRKNPTKKCTEIKCLFCPQIQGIIKPIKTTDSKGQKSQDLWAHPICVNWLQTVWFKDGKNEVIEGQISSLAMKIQCTCCSKRDNGAIIQCDFQGCFRSSYVRCAVKKGWIYNGMMDDLEDKWA